jgi:hypothetical protein
MWGSGDGKTATSYLRPENYFLRGYKNKIYLETYPTN